MTGKERPIARGVLIGAAALVVLAGCSRGGTGAEPGATTVAAGAVSPAARTPAAGTVTKTAGSVARAVSPSAANRGGPTTSPAVPPGAGKPYRDPEGRFTLTLPDGWIETPAQTAAVAFTSPAMPGQVPASVSILLERLPREGVAPEEYDAAGELTLRRQYPDYAPIGAPERLAVDGRPAVRRTFAATIEGRVTQVRQLYLIDRDSAYVVSCGAPRERFGDWAIQFDRIASSLRVSGR